MRSGAWSAGAGLGSEPSRPMTGRADDAGNLASGPGLRLSKPRRLPRADASQAMRPRLATTPKPTLPAPGEHR